MNTDRTRDVGRVAGDVAAHATHDGLGRLVLGAKTGEGAARAEIAPERLGDPVRIRMAERRLRRRALGQRRDQVADPLAHPAHDRVRERDRALEPRATDELDRLVHGGVARNAVEEAELVRPEPQRGADGRVELRDRPLAECLDRVVERPDPLDGAVRKLRRERPVALVERFGGGAGGAVGVRALFEDAKEDGVCRDPRGRDRGAHGRRPRSQAS